MTVSLLRISNCHYKAKSAKLTLWQFWSGCQRRAGKAPWRARIQAWEQSWSQGPSLDSGAGAKERKSENSGEEPLALAPHP